MVMLSQIRDRTKAPLGRAKTISREHSGYYILKHRGLKSPATTTGHQGLQCGHYQKGNGKANRRTFAGLYFIGKPYLNYNRGNDPRRSDTGGENFGKNHGKNYSSWAMGRAEKWRDSGRSSNSTGAKGTSPPASALHWAWSEKSCRCHCIIRLANSENRSCRPCCASPSPLTSRKTYGNVPRSINIQANLAPVCQHQLWHNSVNTQYTTLTWLRRLLSSLDLFPIFLFQAVLVPFSSSCTAFPPPQSPLLSLIIVTCSVAAFLFFFYSPFTSAFAPSSFIHVTRSVCNLRKEKGKFQETIEQNRSQPALAQARQPTPIFV